MVIVGITIADIIGIFPAEMLIVVAVLLALEGGLVVVGVAGAAVVGAVIGDNLLYLLGRHVGPPLVSKLFRSRTSKDRFDWARRQMRRHSPMVIIAGRFIPSGRTAVMFAAGLLDVPWRRFVILDIGSVILWAIYWVGMPYVLGDAISGKTWYTIAISIGVAAVLGGVADVLRRISERRRREGGSKDVRG